MMPAPSRQSISQLLLLSLISFSQLSTATLSLQDLQPIANFPPACQAAYQTPIPSCPDANSFALAASTGLSICSKDCSIALTKATALIQKACQGSSAPPGTVIAHAFLGDLPSFLCSAGSGGGGIQPSSNTNPSSISTASSLTSVPSTANPTATSTSAVANSASTTNTNTNTRQSSTNSAASSGGDTATKTPKPGSSTFSSSNPPNEATATSTSTTTTVRSTTTSSSQPQTSVNNGSPFDQAVPNGALQIDSSASLLLFAMGSLLNAMFF